MKIIYKVILIFLLSIQPISAQRIFEDILVFQDSTSIPAYPFSKKYDSLMSSIKISFDKAYEKDSTIIIDYFPPTPEIFSMINGDSLTLKEYSELLIEKLPVNLWAVVQLDVLWNGVISGCKVIVYEDKKPNIELIKEIVKPLKANPAINIANFPDPGPFRMAWTIRGKNKR